MAGEIERHYVKVAALGRRFHLGYLYNYRNDNIIEGKLFLRLKVLLLVVIFKYFLT
jgi:hypothetical protein